MRFIKAAIKSLDQNKKWIILGAVFYLLPAVYRYVTKNSLVPILDNTLFLYQNNSQVFPVNLEILGAMFIIIGSLGAVVGNSFLEIILKRKLDGTEKYFARVLGSLSFALIWTAIQFLGFNFFNPIGPWGNAIWPSSNVYGRNILISIIIAPLVPYVIEFLIRKK